MPLIRIWPADGPATTGTPATNGTVDTSWAWITGNHWALLGGLLLSALILWAITSKVRKIAQSDKPDDTLSTIGMLIGLGWSGEAMWIIGRTLLHVPIPLLVMLLFVLEINLSVAMIRAKRNCREHGHPGPYATTAWVIAAAMALIAAFAAHSLAEVALRISIPLLVTKTWWDGMVSDPARRNTGKSTWRWTPRRLLLWLGAIEPGERDVETVHRDRLTQQMTNLEFARQYGRENSRKRSAKKLARLSLVADDAIIGEVRRRVSRASWFTVTPLTSRTLDAGDGGDSDADLGGVVKRRTAAGRPKVQTPTQRRVKSTTQGVSSGDAVGADPATLAARLFLTRKVDSIRAAAKQIPGASEATVRRRLKEAGDAAPDADIDLPVAEPAPASVAQANGHHFEAEEALR